MDGIEFSQPAFDLGLLPSIVLSKTIQSIAWSDVEATMRFVNETGPGRRQIGATTLWPQIYAPQTVLVHRAMTV